MATFQIPKPETQQEYIQRSIEKDGKGAILMGLLEAFGARGPISRRPVYNNPRVIRSKAEKDFRNCDFSGAMDYLESALALHDEVESYLHDLLKFLEDEGYQPDENGWPKPMSV